MAKARRSARLKAIPARSHDDSEPTTSAAPKRDSDGSSAHQRRSSKRARGSDGPDRNTRAKRRSSDVGRASSLGERGTGSVASHDEEAAPNPNVTPDPADDTRIRNLLNAQLSPRVNGTIEANHTSSNRPPFPEAASSSDNGDTGESDSNNGTTSVQSPGVAPGAASPTMQHLRDVYNVSNVYNDEHVGDSEGDAGCGGTDADAGADDADMGTEDIDSNVDFEVPSDMNEDNSLPLEAAFNHDIVDFEYRASVQSEDFLFFGPSGLPTTVNLDPKPFLKVFKHMKRKGWTGVRGDWDTQIDQLGPTTTVGKVLSHFARKIERVYEMVSGQPDAAAQTAFFDKHIKPLQYYFGIIAECVRFIRDKRLPLDKTEPLNKAPEKRKRMSMDLANPLIPWLVRLLKMAWHLGGPDSFNDFTIQLVTRTVGWIRQLYNILQRETKATPVPEKKRGKGRARPPAPSNDDGEVERRRKEEKDWREWVKFQEARDQLDTMLQELEALLKNAPDMLVAEEEKQARSEAEMKRLRELEAEKAEQARLKQEQQERERVLQNRNVARSLRREADDGWIEAEVDYLREQLQGATYDVPIFPSLEDTAIRVGHSVEETMEKSRKELRRMLGRMWGDVRSPKQIEAEVKNRMQRWRLIYP